MKEIYFLSMKIKQKQENIEVAESGDEILIFLRFDDIFGVEAQGYLSYLLVFFNEKAQNSKYNENGTF